MKNFSRTGLVVLSLTALFLVACETRSALQSQAETYIRANVSSLSPRSAQVGGTFQVSDIKWIDEDTARVTYEDGHIQLVATTDVSLNGSVVSATRFKIESNNSSSSKSSTSKSSSSGATVGSRVDVCHVTGNSRMTITVDENAVAAHIAHGDMRGACASSSSSKTSTGSSSMTSSSTSSSATSTSSRSSAPGMSGSAGLGEFCGGIAGVTCLPPYRCRLDGNYPDAGGVCAR